MVLVSLAMLAFAGNSLLCRMALKHTSIDAASFTTVRLVSGACMLWLVVRVKGSSGGAGNWWSAAALFVYAAAFSFAYISMSAATGALLLFGSVQATMIGYGVYQGERLRTPQLAGFALALAGLVALMLPGLAAPSLISSLSMLSAGVAWGVYSLRGKRAASQGMADPTCVTAGNFMRAVPMALVLSLLMFSHWSLDPAGIGFAVLSGAGFGPGLRHLVPGPARTQGYPRGHGAAQRSRDCSDRWRRFMGEEVSLPLVLASAPFWVASR